MIGWSRKLLQESGNCLVVIDGLQSTKDWDDVRKSTILPDEATKCCVIVVTDDETVARYCIDGNEELLVHVSEEVHVSLPHERAIAWRRDISDPYLAKRRYFDDDSINDCITEGSPPVASVWGIAGVGKSTLVKWSYTEKMLHPEEFSYYCWVDVPHPFSLAELSLQLLRGFFSDYSISQDKVTAMVSILQGERDPIQECRLLLQQHTKWLLVLDGLWSTDEWDTINKALRLSQPTPAGSKTIVITNEQSIAMHCVNKNDKQVISVQGLEADEALNLFKEKIGNKNIDKEPSDMERVSELSESIVAKCGGLPQVIHAVAEHYKNMSSDKQTYLKLKDTNDNFMHILESMQSLRGLFCWMQHYLETYKDDLKPCIFYLPVFPIGHNIRLRRLQMRWIAEGYITDTSSHTLQKDTARLLSELGESSMFQLQKSSKPVKCQVNGFLHEYINSRPLEDNLVFTLEGPWGIRSQRAGRGLHLTIKDNWDRDINVYGSTDLSRLRSFTVFGECKPFMFDPKKLKMRYVRVLDLEDALCVTNDDLKNIVEVFPRLKFLSLRGHKKITRLPKSLGSLRQLETLDVRHTSVSTLPKAILKLKKLQYVRAGTIHSAPWDEGGIMVPYRTTKPEKINGNTVPAQDSTTLAPPPLAQAEDAAPSAAAASLALTPADDATSFVKATSTQAEDASTTGAASLLTPEEDTAEIAAVTPSDPAEDGTTFVPAPSTPPEDANAIVVTAPPLTHADYAAATVAGAQLDPAEVGTTFVAAPSAPAEVAATPPAAGSEDGKTVPASLLAPDEDDTTATTASSVPEEDPRIVAEDLITSVPVAPSSALVEPTLSTGAEDTTSLAAHPTAAVEHVTSVAAAPMAPSEDSPTAAVAPRTRSRPHALVGSWLSKLSCQSQSSLDNTNNGVEVPAGIGKLTSLHNFGVANVGPGNNSVILKELHKLTLLWRISVCGINPDNIHQFFDAIKGLNQLCRLTVRLDKNRNGLLPCLDETIAQPPNTLDASLKLVGHIRILPGSWIKEFADINYLDLEVTLQEQGDMQVILDHLIPRTYRSWTRLCIKPIQDGELRIGITDGNKFVGLEVDVLEIVCTTNLQATIGNIRAVDVLRVECSTGSSLQLSGLQAIPCLNEVWLKGSCSDTFKQELQDQLDQRQDKDKPVLKVFQPHSS